MDRRSFIRGAGVAAAAIALPSAVSATDTRAAEILRRVRRPEFPARTVAITDAGAVGDGVTDCTAAIQAAIEQCVAHEGGRVLVPPGTYLSGAIRLRDNVELHLAAGATIRFSRDPASYLPVVFTRYEGVECFNYSPFVYAFEATNVAITGSGILDGQASDEHWWDWSGDPPPSEAEDKQLLDELAAQGVPVAERIFGANHYLRPNLVQFYRCTNVLIEGITVRDSPMWNIHPVLCRNVIVDGVTVDSPNGPNNDGCNPESCTDVLIRNCVFNTGDDCIAFKAGKDADGRRVDVPCEYALVEGCQMQDGNGGITIGSETTGGIAHVLARNCQLSSPNLGRALRIKSNPNRGGYVRDVTFRDITVGTVSDSVIEIALDYANVQTGPYYPDVGGIDVHALTAQTGPRAWYLIGNDGNPIRDVSLTDCRFEQMSDDGITAHVDGLQLTRVFVNGTEVTP